MQLWSSFSLLNFYFSPYALVLSVPLESHRIFSTPRKPQSTSFSHNLFFNLSHCRIFSLLSTRFSASDNSECMQTFFLLHSRTFYFLFNSCGQLFSLFTHLWTSLSHACTSSIWQISFKPFTFYNNFPLSCILGKSFTF